LVTETTVTVTGFSLLVLIVCERTVTVGLPVPELWKVEELTTVDELTVEAEEVEVLTVVVIGLLPGTGG